MPLEPIAESSEYNINRRDTNQQIAIQRLKLIHLNIIKVMMDLKEESDNHKLMYEDCKLLQILAEDMNDAIIFINNEILNKK